MHAPRQDKKSRIFINDTQFSNLLADNKLNFNKNNNSKRVSHVRPSLITKDNIHEKRRVSHLFVYDHFDFMKNSVKKISNLAPIPKNEQKEKPEIVPVTESLENYNKSDENSIKYHSTQIKNLNIIISLLVIINIVLTMIDNEYQVIRFTEIFKNYNGSSDNLYSNFNFLINRFQGSRNRFCCKFVYFWSDRKYN